jgi:hypothetical protein
MNNYSNILLNITQIDPLIILSKHVVLTNDNINIKITKSYKSDILKRGIIEAKTTLCQVTGFNISIQKDSSVLLSHTGLEYKCKFPLE